MASKKKKKKRTHAKKIDQKARQKMKSETDREAGPETDAAAPTDKTPAAEAPVAALVSTVKGWLGMGSDKQSEDPPKQAAYAAEPESENGMAGAIKTAIIVVTFVAIAALSVFAQGLDDEGPSVSVVIIRFALLSALAMIYFLMLYMARQSRQKDENKSAAGKK